MEEVLELKKVVTDYKKAQDDAMAELKKQMAVDYATPGAMKAMEEALEGKIKAATDKLEVVNQYAENIEKQLKGKTLTPAEQQSFDALLGAEIEKNWSEITKFKNKRKGASLVLDMKAPGTMTIANNVVDGQYAFNTVIPGIKTLPNRRVHMRNILNLGTMSSSTVTFIRETGGEGDLAPWAVGTGTTDKPQIDRDFEEITVTAEYIAGWLRISRKMLDDMDAVRSYLQMRLMEMYLKVEDAQILNGNGTSPQLEGILTVAQAAEVTTGANIERLIWAISQLESDDYYANGIVLHPAAYYAIALNKATGSGEYDQPGIVVIQNGQLYVAGIPVFKTTAIARDTYIVGDWTLGAQLFIREQPTVEFFDQDRDNVIKNLITVRIEGRVALAIYQPDAFVTGTFTGIPEPTT